MIHQKIFAIPRMSISMALVGGARNGRETKVCWSSHCRAAVSRRILAGRQRLPSPYAQCYHTFANANSATASHYAVSNLQQQTPPWLSFLPKKRMMSSTPSSPASSIGIETTKEEAAESNDSTTSRTTNEDENDKKDPTPMVNVYESQLGSTVNRLRAFSLMTALAGIIGVPIVMAFKGVMPETASLAAALSYVTATTASTTAVNFVFRPYVYTITTVPIRKCSYPKKTTITTNDDAVQTTSTTTNSDIRPSDDFTDAAAEFRSTNETLLKAVTRTVFLRKVEVIFDPETDVQSYKGMRPLCNFEVKGVPLYVHPGACVHACVNRSAGWFIFVCLFVRLLSR